MNRTTPNFHAIIIGINNYGSSSLSGLCSAERDAIELYNYIVKTGGYKPENAELFVNEKATKKNLITALDRFKDNVSSDDTFLFFVSGHGNAYDEFILPLYDYDNNNSDTFLTGGELIKIFEEIKAGKMLFLFDTCYSGILAKEKDSKNLVPEVDIKCRAVWDQLVKTNINNSRVLIASSLPNQTSFEINDENISHGIFTHCLLKALRGACQIEYSPVIHIFDLLRYLVNTVPTIAANNKIAQSCCVKTSLLYQDFVVCNTSGQVDNLTQLPKRYINAVIDLQEDNATLLDQFANGLSRREIESKFTYWGQKVTKKYIELLKAPQYQMPKYTTRLLSRNIEEISKKILQKQKKYE